MNKVSVVLFGFVNFYILIRILSKEDFGAWVLFLSIASLMEPIKRGFVRNPLVRYLAMAPDETVRIQTASLLLNFITGVLQMVFLYLCAIYLSDFWDLPQLRSLFLIYMVSTPLLIPINHLDMMQQARMEFKGPFVSNFVRQFGLFFFILVVSFLRFPLELEYLAYAQLCSIFISGFVSYRYGKIYLKLSK